MGVAGHVDNSVEAWERARRVIPGGVSRDHLYTDPPFFASRGEGPYLFDQAGIRRLDFVNNYTSLIHGHAHPATVSAVTEQVRRGTAFGAPSMLEASLAEEIIGRLDGAEMVRFTNSGTEATMLGLQLARQLTGRKRVAKFEGGFHGWHELVRVSVKPDDGGPRGRPVPVPEEGTEGFDVTDVLPYDDLAAVEQIANERGGSWAALVVEALQGSSGMLPAPPGLLEKCRELADKNGFLLIIDEVLTLRLGGHGLQSEWHVQPHLTTLGKIIGGGLPVGAIAGPATIMEVLAPPRPHRITHSGTFNGNPLTMAAGIATLGAYDLATAQELDTRGDRLRSRLQESLASMGLSVTGWGSIMNIHGLPQVPRSWRDVRDGNRPRVERIQRLLMDRGIYIAPRGLICLSTAHREEHLDELEEALQTAGAETAS